MTDIELIKSKLDIVDVISSYLKDVKKAGANYKVNCPFHNEKTASFMINPVMQRFKCFGCGKNGDVINFIQEIERVDFLEALKISAEKAGVTLTNNQNESSQKNKEEKSRILKANDLTAKFYNYLLQSHHLGKSARDYAQKRKLDAQSIKNFLIGAAPNKTELLKNFLLERGFTEDELLKWGLLVERNGKLIDKFRDRLLNPIFSTKGEVIGFSGRYIGQIEGAPKYLNSPETLVYKKSEILFGLFQAKEAIREKDFIILVEGNIDVISSARVGVKNIAAPLGTAFTPQQAKLLKRFTDNVYFCFDNDAAGIKALIKSMEICEQAGLNHKVIHFEKYKDVDELVCNEPKLWEESVANPKETMDYLMEFLQTNYDLGSAEGKRNYTNQIIGILKTIVDEVVQTHYSRKLAMNVQVGEDVILKRLGIQSTSQTAKKEPEEEIKQPQKESYNDLEFLTLALILQFELDPQNVIEDYFTHSNLKEIFKHYEDNTVQQLIEDLNYINKSTLENLFAFDLKIENKETAQNLLNKNLILLKKIYLKSQILNSRKNLNSEDDLSKLNSLIKKLK